MREEQDCTVGKDKKTKKPISRVAIYRIITWVTIIVSSVFFVKNILSKNIAGIAVIGISLFTFIIVTMVMKVKKVKPETREMVVAIGIVLLVFTISLYSGESYSDDFPMFLAVIGLTGLYMEPKYTLVQIGLIDVAFVLMYVINPAKAGNLSQYGLCFAIFVLAASLFYQTIKRGRAFIEMSDERAKEAEKILNSMREMGDRLQEDFEKSSARIDDNTKGLQLGSMSIVDRTNEISESCGDVHDRIKVTEQTIGDLNEEVRKFETALNDNRSNMEAMSEQLKSVGNIIYSANDVFESMEAQMVDVAKITEQLNSISFNTTTLSFNASIEAARAGEAGVGFEVVATEMRKLSVTSNKFSEQVAEVVNEFHSQVEEIVEQFRNSTKALEESDTTMKELQDSFERLINQFENLYSNIEEQNNNVELVDNIFNELNARVNEMRQFTADNQRSVEGIVEAMDTYKVNIGKVIENTRI